MKQEERQRLASFVTADVFGDDLPHRRFVAEEGAQAPSGKTISASIKASPFTSLEVIFHEANSTHGFSGRAMLCDRIAARQ